MRSRISYFGLAVVMLTLAACHARHKAEITLNGNADKVVLTGDQVRMDENSFDWFDGKFNAEVSNNGKVNTFKGRVRMRCDSLIWISIKPDVAIIEAFRMLISKDSIKLIDYIHKEYFVGDFGFISSAVQYDVNFGMVQGLFVGNPHFMFGRKDYQVSVASKDTILSSSDLNLYMKARKSAESAKFLFQAVWVNGQHKAWRNLVYDPKNRMEMDIQYPEYQLLDSALYPKTGQLTIVGDTVNTRFIFDYTKTELHTEFDFPFTIPESYKPIEIKK